MTTTKWPDLWAALASEFAPREVKHRTQSGKDLQYITARTAMNRLDAVLGPENWWDDYERGEESVLCRLTIRLPDGATLTKCDAGGYAGMADQGDDDKSGYSDAFKRAAVKFGVGRYLYRDGVVRYAGQGEPDPEPAPARQPVAVGTHANGDGRGINREIARAKGRARMADGERAPTKGRELFAWAKDNEKLQALTAYGQIHGFPARIVDWDRAQILEAFDAVSEG